MQEMIKTKQEPSFRLLKKNFFIQSNLNQKQPNKINYSLKRVEFFDNKSKDYHKNFAQIENKNVHQIVHEKIQQVFLHAKKAQVTARGDTVGLLFLMKCFFSNSYQSPMPKKMAQTHDRLNHQKASGWMLNKNAPSF